MARRLTLISSITLILCLVSTWAVSGTVFRLNEDDYHMFPWPPFWCWSNSVNGNSMTNPWLAEMEVHGWGSVTLVDSGTRLMLTDPDRDPELGQDFMFLEAFDVGMITCHGGLYEQDGQTRFEFRMNTRYDGSCFVEPRNWMMLGELSGDDIEILHLYSCSSMTVDNQAHANTWRAVFGGIHQIHGFHGVAQSGVRDRLQEVADDGFDSGVAFEWVNELYVEDIEPGIDNCPVAYTGRNSDEGALFLFGNEQYDSRDSFDDIYQPTHWKRLYIPGCHPAGANPM